MISFTNFFSKIKNELNCAKYDEKSKIKNVVLHYSPSTKLFETAVRDNVDTKIQIKSDKNSFGFFQTFKILVSMLASLF